MHHNSQGPVVALLDGLGIGAVANEFGEGEVR
jgi:hypothetical protein